MIPQSHILLGSRGFVGSALLRAHAFDHSFHTENRGGMLGLRADLLVCAAAPGTKWLANKDPENDMRIIRQIQEDILSLDPKKVVLISTVDVFSNPIGVYEDTPIVPETLSPYGRHRYELEMFLRSRLDTCVIRLPGLFGEGLKKNLLFDMLVQKVDFVDERSVLQWYNIDLLWSDVQRVITAGIPTLNLATEPISTKEIRDIFFDTLELPSFSAKPVEYDMRTHYSHLWGREGDYAYGREAVLSDLAKFIQTHKAI